MDPNNLEEAREIYQRAEKRVEEKIGFFRHLGIYLFVNLILLAVNLILSRDFLWVLVPICTWGIAIVAHYFSVFILGEKRLEEWKKRAIEKEIQKIKEKKG